jgi:hypothetical protein
MVTNGPRFSTSFMAGRAATLVIACLALASRATADPIRYTFTATASTGALADQTSTGTLAFDSSIVPPAGGRVVGANLFTELDFVWDGVKYDTGNSQTSFLLFDSAGGLSQWAFGTACIPSGTGCVVRLIPPGFEDWVVQNTAGPAPPLFFEYGLPDRTFGFGRAVLTPDAPAPTPEPSSIALFAAAVAACWRVGARSNPPTLLSYQVRESH